MNSFPIDRRGLLGGIGATLLAPAVLATAQNRVALALEAVAGTLAFRTDQPAAPIWQLGGGPDAGALRFKRGDTVDVTLTNRLPVPVALNWNGLDGNPMADLLSPRAAIQPNASATTPITFSHAGTMTVDIRRLGDANARPTAMRPVIVTETEPLTIDRDEVLLLQDWRFNPDGSATALGNDPKDSGTAFTVNGAASFDITASQNQRLRLRLINACQRSVIAIKLSDHDLRVMAIDGQPSEPFSARDGLVVLTAGSRVDVFVDAVRPPGTISPLTLLYGRELRPIGRLMVSDGKPARPAPLPIAAALPSNDLPAQLDLKSALRADLALGTGEWINPAGLTSATLPAFKTKRGRTVVLALANRGVKPAIFHLHGHHFRLLDRLDDGWKPFWLDTLAVDAGQIQRIAFMAEHAGFYAMESTTTDWASARLFRSYLVE